MNDPIGKPPQLIPTPAPVPPPVPTPIRASSPPRRTPSGPFSNLESTFAPAQAPLTLLGVVEALLKRPGQLIHEIVHSRGLRVPALLLAAVSLCLLAYGFLMGTFSGGPQLWVLPLKVCLGYLASALICLPSLYIFTCLSGGSQSVRQVCGLLLICLALSALLLVGFAPIVWIFAQSTGTVSFMGLLHLLFWAISAHFGIKLLFTGLEFLNRQTMQALNVWGLMFLLVVLQMCACLRPLVGKFEGFRLQEKQFFLVTWQDALWGD